MSPHCEVHDWPLPSFHAFLSHSAEDRDDLVLPVLRALRRRQLLGWFDQYDYPSGREPIEALQQSLLRCLHVVYFITPAQLDNSRGWTAAERTLSDLAQRQMRLGSRTLHHLELPLFFVPHQDAAVARSIWNPLRMNGLVCPHPQPGTKAVRWAAAQIARFITQERDYRDGIRAVLRVHLPTKAYVDQYAGLRSWLSSDL